MHNTKNNKEYIVTCLYHCKSEADEDSEKCVPATFLDIVFAKISP